MLDNSQPEKYSALDLTDKETCHPFSNGTEAMDWVTSNCDQCSRSYLTRNPPNPEDHLPMTDETYQLVRDGRECIGKMCIDFGFICGSIPNSVAEWIGGEVRFESNGQFANLPGRCNHFTDNDLGYLDRNPDGPPDDPNQLCIPWDPITYLVFGSDILATKTAIFEST